MADALVGGALLSAFLQVLFDRLASPEVLNFFRRQKLDVNLMRKLRLTLLTIKPVLNDAEEKQFTNKDVKEWVVELQDAVYEAEDLVGEIDTEALRCKILEKESQSSRSSTKVSSSSSILSVKEIRTRILQVIERLEYFVKERDVLGLRAGVGGSYSSHQRLPTTSLVDESAVFGRDVEKEKLIQMLISDDPGGNDIGVIPIVGMGGVGKTTLAQLIYNDPSINSNLFDMKAWVCVSEEFDIIRVTKTILEEVASQTSDTNNLNRLQVKLADELREKKFLLVLDDLWTERYEDWDVLRNPIRAGARGSKVIVTTRSDKVASIMQTVSLDNLKPLSPKDCWSLFVKHAFKNEDLDEHSNLEGVGRDIVNKCKGLPLAVKTLGGMFRCKRDFEEWDSVLKSEIWDLLEGQSNILPALRLSYHYLPSPLKRCFSFCSVFPKDHKFRKDEVVPLWIAHNLVQKPTGGKSLEEIGDSYFHELLSSSLFQRSGAGKSWFVMHDLVHDLADFVSKGFVLRAEHGKLPHYVCEKVRHFSYSGVKQLEAVSNAKCLRTFLSLNYHFYGCLRLPDGVLYDMLPGLRCLRVLSLSSYTLIELPYSIDNLVHLRYLDLSSTRIKRLPDSVTSLCNLQMLFLNYCYDLEELPREIGKLVHLRHLGIIKTKLREMPPRMGELKDLRILAYFVVGKDSGSEINELGPLCHLCGTLSILELQNIKDAEDAAKANLKYKKHLEGLVLQWGSDADDSRHERNLLNNLQPHGNLKELEIIKYGGTSFPKWLGDLSLSSIVVLSLDSCEHCLKLPSLGLLRSLEKLTIARMEGVTNVGPEFYGDDSSIKPFPSLKILRFEVLREWKEWHISGVNGLFCSLKELCIIDCPKLTGGFPKTLPSLVMLEISKCHRQFFELSHGLSSPLQKLRIVDVSELEELPRLQYMGLKEIGIQTYDALQSQPWGVMCTSSRLERLTINSCSSLVSLSMGDLPTTLKHLGIMKCRNLELCFPEGLKHRCTSLESFSIWSSCQSLITFSLGFFPKLSSLELRDCPNLESFSIPDGHPNDLSSLRELWIDSCPKMVSFPEGGLAAPNLSLFYVKNCGRLKSLPARLNALLTSLQKMYLYECPEVESLPGGGLPSTLKNLEIKSCDKLMVRRMEWGLHRLPCLETFSFSGVESSGSVESFPDESLLPSTLGTLEISDISHLKSLNGKALQHLTSLKMLDIWDFPEMQSLPEEGLPASLSCLNIFDCPLLRPRCQREKGQDWPKISHVDFIQIDGEVI